ncbi:MAG: TldD/PmbA family protein [Bacilli bacterium]|nr:TldD/PmbA family protein [Bacilli bacterium]
MINDLINIANKEGILLEVYNVKSKSVNIETLNDKLINYNISDDNSYKIKSIINNKTIVLNYESLENPENIIDTIKHNANVIDNDNKNSLTENDYTMENRKEKNDIDFSVVKKELLRFNDYKDKYPFLLNIDSSISYEEINVSIDNLKHHLNDSYNYIYVYISLSGKKNNIVKTKLVNEYYDNFDIDDLKNKIEKAIKELELEFSATSVFTNKYKVLLDNNVVKSILYNMSNMFDAKSMFMKLSILSDKLNQKIFSDKITILEEPLNPKFIVNRHFDNEGTLMYNKEIVKNGIFKTAFNNLEYAYKTNSKPTGNASGFYNLHIKEGNKSYNELIKELDNGIIITQVEGLHAGINHITGDISLQSEGLLVENGQIKKALNLIILSTNIKELLNNVIEVGNDLKEFGYSISSPSLLVDNITISGSGDK